MYSLQWMGAVRIRVQTADKNVTIPAHQLSSSEEKICLFIRVLYPKWCFVQWKVSSESGQKYAPIKHRLWAKTFKTSFDILATSNSLKLKDLIHKTIIGLKGFFWGVFYIADSLDLFVKKAFFPLHSKKHRKAIDSETDISGKAGRVSSISAASLFMWVTGVEGQCRAGPSELRHKPFFTVIGWDRPVTPGGLRGISPSPSSENACWLNGLRIWCLSRTLPSLHFYQIFIMLSYSTLTVWQNSIMWTRWPQIVTRTVK